MTQELVAGARRDRRVVNSPLRESYKMFIGGQWAEASSGAVLTSIDPCTEEVLARFPHAGADDVDRAATAAVKVAPEWAATSWQSRAGALRELADRLERQAADFGVCDALDGGIPVGGMRKDLRNSVDFLRYFAGIAAETKGSTMPAGAGCLNYTVREPYGVVGRIVPFNHPIQFAAAGIAGPLAAGNTVILKPAQQTSLSALHLAELAEGLFPAGVLNVITGDGSTGAAIVAHPAIPRIAFTGSVPSGKAVLRAAAENVKAVSLELGGKNPLVVFADVDVARTAQAAVQAMNFRRGQGQSCGSPSRIFVHADVHDQFVNELSMLVEGFRIGDPLLEETDMGPLAFAAHYDRVRGYLDDGIADGARLVTGGKRPASCDRGYFLEPTIFDNVSSSMRIAREEIFGPVVSILKWRDADDVLDQINELPLGLTANVWTNDLSAAMKFAAAVESGYVWINGQGQRPLGAPFGGYKHSGLGAENGLDELLSYTQTKNINISQL